MMYTFYKYNPRTEPGHRDGDLGSPPAPGFGGHGGDFNSEPLIIMGGAFLVVAVALCLFGAASHARRQLSYMSVIKCVGFFSFFPFSCSYFMFSRCFSACSPAARARLGHPRVFDEKRA